jgi:hypothetical protein
MGLFDEIKDVASTPPGPRCGVSRILAAMSAEDASDLQKALDDPSIYGTTISEVLKKHGHSVTGYTVTRHRKKRCSCE